MAEEKDIALLADNDIIVEIEVQEAPTVIVETPNTTTAEISGDSAIGIVVSALPTLAKEATLLTKVAELKEALNSIDFTAIEQAIQNVEDVTAKEATLIQGVADVIKAVENIDFTDLENSIADVKNAVANIDFSALAKQSTLLTESQVIQEAIQNINLSFVESKVEEVGNKIDNIKLPEIDTSAIAQQATLEEVSTKVTNLEALITDSLLLENVTIILNSANQIAWNEYEVIVSTSSGNMNIPIEENGTCTFSIRYGQEYSVFLPVIGSFIIPQKQTYTAQSPSKTIYWSYVLSGVFGIDEVGRRYTAEEIEAYTDRSFIKFIGYTDEFLENYVRDDGRVGIGFILAFESSGYGNFASSDIEFSTQLLPFVTTVEEAELCADGELNTKYILEEGTRLGVNTPAASYCNGKSIVVNNITKKGYMPSAIQVRKAKSNASSIKRVCELLGKTMANFSRSNTPTSNQHNETSYIYVDSNNNLTGRLKSQAIGSLITFYALN